MKLKQRRQTEDIVEKEECTQFRREKHHMTHHIELTDIDNKQSGIDVEEHGIRNMSHN